MKHFSKIKGSHDWEHTERVYTLCMCIGKKENANLEILKYAAILHDIARSHQDKSNGFFCHAKEGGILAKKLLEKYNVDSKKIDKIVDCIQSHRFRGDIIPQTIEAKVLFDSDKLDSIACLL